MMYFDPLDNYTDQYIYCIYRDSYKMPMQAIELPLYPTFESIPEVIPEAPKEAPKAYSSLADAINSIIPDQSEENKVLRMRKHLGKTAENLSDAQVETITTEFQFLIDNWLDEYERDVFNGMTLKEVLNGG